MAADLGLYAAGSLKAALNDVARTPTRSSTARRSHADLRGLRAAARAHRAGRGAGRLRLGQHGAPEALADAGWGGPVALFARNRLCALAQPGLEVGTRDAARHPAGQCGPARHLDAQGGSLGRLCLAAVREGGRAAAGRVRDARCQGAAADRRPRQRKTARGPQHLCLGDGAGARRPVPHLLHQRGARAKGGAGPADRGGAGRAVGRRRLWPVVRQGRAAAGVAACALHPVARGPGDPRRLRLHQRRAAAEG